MAGRGDKGLLITTGTFTADSQREAVRDGAPAIDLIDGDRLCELLKRYELGVHTEIPKGGGRVSECSFLVTGVPLRAFQGERRVFLPWRSTPSRYAAPSLRQTRADQEVTHVACWLSGFQGRKSTLPVVGAWRLQGAVPRCPSVAYRKRL